MKSCEEDNVTGINYKWLNQLVFNFFPFSSMGFHNRSQLWLQFYSLPLKDQFSTTVGSTAEKLQLPIIYIEHGEFDSGLNYIVPDLDMMVSSNVDNKDVWHLVTQNNKYPLHCQVTGFDLASSKFLGNCSGSKLIEGSNDKDRIKHLYKVEGVNTKILHDKRGSYIDKVPCLNVPCPEHIIKQLQERFKGAGNSCLPLLTEVAERLRTDGIHVVHKPPIKSEDPDSELRFSFSMIERELALSLNDTQRTAYRALKGLIKSEINDKAVTDNKKLPTYLLKTSLFWVCEKLPRNSCKSSNIGKFFLLLLDKLLHSVSDGWISMFFIPEGNLLDSYDNDNLRFWMEGLSRIRNYTLDVMMNFWKVYNLNFAMEVNKFLVALFEAAKPYPKDVHSFNQSETTSKNADARICVICRIRRMHAELSNVRDIIRLLIAFDRVVCLCDERIIEDFEDVCWKCMIPVFCKLAEEYPNIFFPYLLPEIANLWYIRSLQDEENKDLYRNKAALLFEAARKNPSTCYSNTHYALYLMAEQRYEEAVATILEVLSPEHSSQINEEFILSNFLMPMLDDLFQLQFSGTNFRCFTFQSLLYQLLCSCYIHTGVCAEICFPPIAPYSQDYDRHLYMARMKGDAKDKICYQLFLKGDYQKAAEYYASDIINGEKITTLGFVACIANMYNILKL